MGRAVRAVLAGATIACHGPKPEPDIVPPPVVALQARPEVADSSLRGIIISDNRRTRIGEARVSLEDSTTHVLTANDGRFTLLHVPPGRQVIHVRRIGYRRLDQVVEMPAGHGAAVVIWLAEDRMCMDDCPDPPPPRHSRLENVP